MGGSDAAVHGGVLAGFDRVVIQDGSSFAVKDAPRGAVSGAVQDGQPGGGGAARDDGTAGGGSLADSLRDALPLADRGYFDVAHLAAVDRAGRPLRGARRQVDQPDRAACRGERPPAGRPARPAAEAVRPAEDRPARSRRELAQGRDDAPGATRRGAGTGSAEPTSSWSRNLPRERVSAEQVCQVCRLRWPASRRLRASMQGPKRASAQLRFAHAESANDKELR